MKQTNVRSKTINPSNAMLSLLTLVLACQTTQAMSSTDKDTANQPASAPLSELIDKFPTFSIQQIAVNSDTAAKADNKANEIVNETTKVDSTAVSKAANTDKAGNKSNDEKTSVKTTTDIKTVDIDVKMVKAQPMPVAENNDAKPTKQAKASTDAPDTQPNQQHQNTEKTQATPPKKTKIALGKTINLADIMTKGVIIEQTTSRVQSNNADTINITDTDTTNGQPLTTINNLTSINNIASSSSTSSKTSQGNEVQASQVDNAKQVDNVINQAIKNNMMSDMVIIEQTQRWIAEPKITLNLQSAFPPSKALELQKKWASKIAKQTNNEVDIRLVQKKVVPTKTLEAVASGEIDGHIAPLHYFGAVDPAYSFVGDMIAWKEPKKMISFINSQKGFDMMQQLHGDKVTYLGGMTTGTESLVTDKRIESLEDFEGMSIRTPEGLVDDMFKKLGANTVQLSFPQIKPAFQAKKINATDFSVLSVNKDFGINKLGKYSIYPGFHSTPLVEIAVNSDKWKQVSPQSQDLIEQSILLLSKNTLAETQQADLEALNALKKTSAEHIISLPQAERERFRQMSKEQWINQSQQSDKAKLVYDTVLRYGDIN